MRLYNSLTKTKEEFKPINGNEVKLYVCGITPYDTTHLGHAFTYIAFDILQRYLTFKGYTVTYTQNVTDIDDDILRKAREVNKNWQELGQFWTDKFLNDLQALNVGLPNYYVKATDSIPAILEMIEGLVKKEFAYEKNGNVYFRVTKDKDYGKLSRYSRQQMIMLSKDRGANPDDPNKEDPLDFILWQKMQPGEPSWDSLWGKGRPGWHIECSSMIYSYLGKQIDIHGGGHDLMYPHHESEIAQSEQFTGLKPFVKYWMHTGAVMYEGEKMSKSLGNLVMVSDLLKKYSATTIRYALLKHHYRTPWEFHESELATAEKEIKVIKQALQIEPNREEQAKDKNFINEFTTALDDDLDTPQALAVVQELAKKNQTGAPSDPKTLHDMTSLLGLKNLIHQ